MKLALLLLALAQSPSSDALSAIRVKTITLKIPNGWQKLIHEGSIQYTAPSGDAFFNVNVGRVQSQGMKAEVCRQKIIAKMGDLSGWKLVTLGGQPGAERRDIDQAQGGEVHTYTFVGCDGATTWSLVFHLEGRKKDRFTPLVERIAASVSYLPPDEAG